MDLPTNLDYQIKIYNLTMKNSKIPLFILSNVYFTTTEGSDIKILF